MSPETAPDAARQAGDDVPSGAAPESDVRSGAFRLDRALAAERDRVEAALERSLESLEPLLGEDEFVPAVRYGVLGGGKRVRPILCVAAYRATGGESEEAIYDLAVSLELIHAYSLMHDDLPCMDDAALRRGRPTAHREFGEERTMVAGAVLIPAASLQAWRATGALSLPEALRRRVVGELTGAAGAAGMVGGQALDLLAEERELDLESVARLHALKTGALLAAAPAMGGLAAGADEGVVQGLRSYGEELGLAFQIADDVLDATGSASDLGKEPSDAGLAKSTYVSRLGVEDARRRARRRSEKARGALADVGLASRLLDALAEYVVRRST